MDYGKGASRNRSMLEDEGMDDVDKLKRRFAVGSSDQYILGTKVLATVGHVYSVMVEELDIDRPNLRGFIEEMNEFTLKETGWSSFADGPTDYLLPHTAWVLQHYLFGRVKEGKMYSDSAERIMREAIGGFEWGIWLKPFKSEPEKNPARQGLCRVKL